MSEFTEQLGLADVDDTTTTRLGLIKPSNSSRNYRTKMNTNMDTLDSAINYSYEIDINNYATSSTTIDDGTTDIYTAFAAAIAACPTNGTILFPNRSTTTAYKLITSIVVPSGINLRFEPGAWMDGTGTLTGTNTRIISTVNKIFDVTLVVAGTFVLDKVYPEHYGANRDGTTEDTTVFTKTIRLASKTINKKIQCLEGSYLVSNVSWLSGVTMKGVKGLTIIKVKNKYNVEYSAGNYDIGNYNVFKGDTITGVYLEDITIEGIYETAWGNQTIRAIGSTLCENLLYFQDCTDVHLKGVVLQNTFSSFPTIAVDWQTQMNTIYGMNQIKISGCTNVTLDSCGWKDSCGEAWEIWNSTNVRVYASDFVVNYCVSQLDITYCTDVKVYDNRFKRILQSNTGNLLNIASSNVQVWGNEGLNGEFDIGGNEGLNYSSTIGGSFLIKNVNVFGNVLVNAGFTSATSSGTTTLTYTEEDVTFNNNTIILNLDTIPGYVAGGVFEFTAFRIAPNYSRKNINYINNTIRIKGSLKGVVDTHNFFQIFNGRMSQSGYTIRDMTIKGNKIYVDLDNYDADLINHTSANMIFNYGNYVNLTIKDNIVDSPLAMCQFENFDSFTNCSIDNNEHYNGRVCLNFPYSNVNTEIDGMYITRNKFKMLEDSYSHSSADIVTNGFGKFINLQHAKVTDIDDLHVHDNKAWCAGFADIANTQTNTAIDNSIYVTNNKWYAKDITIGSGTMYGLKLGGGGTGTTSDYYVTGNEVYSDPSTTILVTVERWKRLRFEDNTLVSNGDFTFDLATDNVAGEATSQWMWNRNSGVDAAGSTITRTNAQSAVVKRNQGNDGFLSFLDGTLTWNPGSLVDGAGETSGDITVTDARVGDGVDVFPPYSLQGILCTGFVNDDNDVQIRLQNETGGTIDLASGVWKVRVTKT